VHINVKRLSYRYGKAVFLISWLVLGAVQAQSQIRLNDTLAERGDVTDFQITPDGSKVVYIADQNTDNVFELFVVPIEGGAPLKLNAPLVANGDVLNPARFFEAVAFQISPDGSRVVYSADQNIDDVFELFSVSINGGPVVKLNGNLTSDGDIELFKISPDGTRVVYFADQDINDVPELFSVPINGGAVVKLNTDLVAGRRVFPFFDISSDSSRVVYSADQSIEGEEELFSVALSGGTQTKLNSANETGVFVQISPDGMHVLYRGVRNGSISSEPFAVPITGGTPIGLAGGFSGSFARALFTPDSSRVIFSLNGNIFSAAITGDNLVRLNDSFSSRAFIISPDGNRVVFDSGPNNINDTFNIVSVLVTGGTPVILNGDLRPGPNDSNDFNGRYLLSPDGSRVLFRARTVDESNEIFSTAITGGVITSITPEPDGLVSLFQFSADGTRILYMVESIMEGNNVMELFTTLLDGDGATKVNDELVEGGDITFLPSRRPSFGLSPNGEFAVYAADQNIDNQTELFSVRLSELESENTGDLCFNIVDQNRKVVALVCL